MTTTNRQIQAVYRRFSGGYYVFEATPECGGEIYHLRAQELSPSARAILTTPNAAPGFRVTLEYRTGPSSGLWYVV